MRDIFSLEPITQILTDDSYVVSYPYLLDYFSSKQSFSAADVVCGAHMVYGWMPTILELYPSLGETDLDAAAEVLTKAKEGKDIASSEVEALAILVNNSVVGASKLLHFAAPNHFPIWDSKVYSFIHEKRPHFYRVNSVETYLQYVSLLKCLEKRPELPDLHKSIQKKLGYKVSPLRALELVIFLNAPVL